MRRNPLTTALVTAFVSLLAAAPAQQLTPSSVLRIDFRINLPFNRTPNTLKLNFGLTSVQQAYGTRRASLYDCDRLLGSYASSLFGTTTGNLNLDPGASWKSPTSPWTFDNGATADFTTIQNGTIMGIIDFTIDNGAHTIPLGQVNLNMIDATSSSGGSVVTPNPTVTDVKIVPKLSLPVPGQVNATNVWSVTGAQPNSSVYLGIGTQCFPLQILGVYYDITNPLVFLQVPTDALGAGSLSLFVPGYLTGGKVLIQGVQLLGPSSFWATSLSPYTF